MLKWERSKTRQRIFRAKLAIKKGAINLWDRIRGKPRRPIK
ncbi:MAG: hypothetical protein AABW72_02825 [archaeon]